MGPLDPVAADGLSFGTQLSMNARRAVSSRVASMDSLDIAQQRAIGDLARALRLGSTA
jgi:hypothetical protein